MPALGLNATWGREEWAAYVLEHLAVESVLFRAGVRVLPIAGRVAHVPRTLTDGVATWTGEGEAIASNAPTGDELVLTPKKLGNVVTLSRESIADAPVDELDAVGNALTRSVATAIDTKAFSADAATDESPAGLRTLAIPEGVGEVTLDNITRATGTIASVGGIADAAFLNPLDRVTLSLLKDGQGRPLLVEALAAAGLTLDQLYSTPALPQGIGLVAEAAQIVAGVRRDIEVAFSSDAKFTADSIAARVTARADFGVNDLRGLVLLRAAV